MKNFTRIDNEFLIAITCANLSKNEIRVILFIFRFSNGCRSSEAILIPRDFTTIGIQESQIGSILNGLDLKRLINWDKSDKKLSVNYEELIETARFEEDKLRNLLSKNIRKSKVRTSNDDNEKLIGISSRGKDSHPSQSQNIYPKDNKDRLNTTKTVSERTDVELKLIKFLEGVDKVKNPEAYLGWIIRDYGTKHLSKLIDLDFHLWKDFLDEWKKSKK